MSDFTERVAALIERWRAILISLAALVVIVLQIVNMLLTGGGHESIQALVAKLTDKTIQNREKIDLNRSKIEAISAQTNGIKAELDDIEKKLDGGHR